MASQVGRTKTVVLYKIFPSNAAAAAEGYTIKGVATRKGTHYGKMETVPMRVRQASVAPVAPVASVATVASVANVDQIAELLGGLGLADPVAQPVAQVLAAAPGQQIIAVGQADGPAEVNVDALQELIVALGIKNKGGKRKTHRRVTRRRRTHRRRTHRSRK